MSDTFSRRDFLKLAGVGAATSAVLTGCGPASRYVKREPYMKMPEYTYNGLSTYYATTCRECAAGCGLIVRTMQGRAIKVEGNPNHPVNLGKTCARGQASIHGLYNPNRMRGPLRHGRGEALVDTNMEDLKANMTWEEAVGVVAEALGNNRPSEIAFLLGNSPDHLFDLITDLSMAINANAPIRFGALSMFEARATLIKASEIVFGEARLPYFDLGKAEVVFSFGANFLETWLSPVAYTRGFSQFRRGDPNRRGYFVQFEARLSQTAAKADEWIPIRPGTEGLVALALGRLIAEAQGSALPRVFSAINPEEAATQAGVALETLKRLAGLMAQSGRPLVIPGGAPLALGNGLSNAQAILTLNALLDNLGKSGGVYLSALAPTEDPTRVPSTVKVVGELIEKMKSGSIKVLLVHGANPVFEIPQSLGFVQALANVPQVISFGTFPDETAQAADYIFPDHHGLESWGYQRVVTGVSQPALSGAQPVVSPFYDTRATVDVLLAAAQKASATLLLAFPFQDEVEYLQSKLTLLSSEANGFFNEPAINTFMASFQQYGGWWKTDNELITPIGEDVLNGNLQPGEAQISGEGEFFLAPFMSPTLGEAGANKPWLQELPDPTTTVMWNTWVEINPKTAEELGIDNDDVVLITSDVGAVEASVYKYPAIRPDTIAIPFGQGHTAYGRFAAGRGANPANLFGRIFNEAGDLAYAGMKVRIAKTGKKQLLSRLESKIGVYGEGLKEK